MSRQSSASALWWLPLAILVTRSVSLSPMTINSTGKCNEIAERYKKKCMMRPADTLTRAGIDESATLSGGPFFSVSATNVRCCGLAFCMGLARRPDHATPLCLS